MINIIFHSEFSQLTGFEVSGHSMSAPKGEDIICAAVSSACLMTANTATEVVKIKADTIAMDGKMCFFAKENSQSIQDLLSGLMLHLTELQKEYPDNIQVRISEV